MKDLVVLTADKNCQFAVQGALGRHERLGIRPITFEFRVHPNRDGGCRKTGAAVLAREVQRFSHALLLLDFEGSGAEKSPLSELEAKLDAHLATSWGKSAKSIVIEPEADIWLWGSDNAIETVIGWSLPQRIRTFLTAQGFTFSESGKPDRPKEAIECALRAQRTPRSSALYGQIAASISLQRCSDPSFLRLRQQLQAWFPRGTEE